jgi:uncharacterized protein YbaP (TraB family)
MSAKSASVRARRPSVVAIRQARRAALRRALVQARSSVGTSKGFPAWEAALALSAPLCARSERRAGAGAVADAWLGMGAASSTPPGGQV